MKLLRQLLIILTICFMGEFINRLFNVPVPGNVIGMVILFICLFSGLIKLEMINEITKFLLDHLAFFFLPAAVGLITSLNVLKENGAAFLIICLLTTIMVTVVTGHVVQLFKRGVKR